MKLKLCRLLFPLLLCALATLTLACSRSTPNNNPQNIIQNSNFRLTAPAADRYENIEGTALYNVAPDLSEYLAALGPQAPAHLKAFFILLNPKAPSEAILVQAPSDIPQEAIKNQASSVIVLTGNVKGIKCPALSAYVKESLGADLATTANGDLAYIEAETPIDFNLTSTKPASSQRIEIPLEGTPLGQPLQGEPPAAAATPASEPAAAAPEAAAPESAPAPQPVTTQPTSAPAEVTPSQPAPAPVPEAPPQPPLELQVPPAPADQSPQAAAPSQALPTPVADQPAPPPSDGPTPISIN